MSKASNKLIAIRTTVGVNVGLGHLFRMLRIANELKKNDKKVVFLINQTNGVIEKYLNCFNWIALYDSDFDSENFNAIEDAQLCLEFLKNKAIDKVIVDSYVIGIDWEDRIVAKGYELVVFDDLQREHNCHYLIDQKWQGNLTSHRYDNLVSDKCKKLLGPAFFSVDKAEKDTKRQEDFVVMLSLGGGGDLQILQDLTLELSNSKSIKNIIIMPVIGSFATSKEIFLDLFEGIDNIQPIVNQVNLSKYYQKTSLFIGALGTMFFEAKMYNIPTITFSLAENQENDFFDLEDFGHYFHLSLGALKQTEKMTALVASVSKHYDRVYKLGLNSKVVLDGSGAKRVVQSLTGQTVDKYQIYNKKTVSDKGYFLKLSNNLIVRKVNDTDINHYLKARNLPINSNNMLVSQDIEAIEHYSWWFNTQRDSYVVELDNEVQLYIWHQKISFKNKDYLIGGWFSANEKTGFEIAFSALNWQLDYTNDNFPDATWIAIIKKDNKYVNLLNSYLKFEAVEENSAEFYAIEDYFGKVSSEYNYVKK